MACYKVTCHIVALVSSLARLNFSGVRAGAWWSVDSVWCVFLYFENSVLVCFAF